MSYCLHKEHTWQSQIESNMLISGERFTSVWSVSSHVFGWVAPESRYGMLQRRHKTTHTHIHDLCETQHNEHVHDHSLTTTSRATLLKHWLCSVVWTDQQNKQSYLTRKQWLFSLFEQSNTTSGASLNISSDRVQLLKSQTRTSRATLLISSDRFSELNSLTTQA